jgi:hypothetical protein
MKRPLTPAELKRRQEGNAPRETIAKERLWRKRPDGIAIKRPTKTKSGVFCILELQEDVGCCGSIYRKSQTGGRGPVRARQAAED